MKRLIADGFSFGDTPPPWRVPDKLPATDLIQSGIGTVEASLVPVDIETAKVIILKLADTFPTFGAISKLQEKHRTETWLAANKDLPSDLWVQAYLSCARSPSLKRMPTPGEFRAFVAPQFERRKRDLARLQAMLAASTGVAAAKAEAAKKPAPPPDTEQAKLRVLIRSAKMLGQWDVAQERENRLAELEGGRAPEVFVKPKAPAPVSTLGPERRPEIDIWKLPVSDWMTPAEKVHVLRGHASSMRRLGPSRYADWLDDEADKIEGVVITDIAEAS